MKIKSEKADSLTPSRCCQSRNRIADTFASIVQNSSLTLGEETLSCLTTGNIAKVRLYQ
jgi:hypothetical protein